MLLKITIILSVIFQAIAALAAIRLIKKTKYNFAWLLITIGLVSLMIIRVVDFIPLVSDFQAKDFKLLYIWIGTISSMFFALGVILIRQIFNYMHQVETKRRNTENHMLSSIIAAEESERQRLAKEIHDDLGPIMSTIRLTTSSIEQNAENPQQKMLAKNATSLIKEALKSVRNISTNLSPHMLDNFGLEKALQNFINKINASSEFTIKLELNLKDEKFGKKVQTIIYRVSCEMITNTIKHAFAKSATLKINTNDDYLLLDYSDNGKGFDVNDVLLQRHGMGISNIYSRISSLNGSVDILSDKNTGTSIKIYVPLNYELNQ
jgi:signal transduction histidine kinase